jgi:glycosyltransferase involved in cell wall biosynthesis
MRILIAVPWLPWPLDSGGNVAVVNSLACLQRQHELTLICPVYGEQGAQAAASLQAHLAEVRVHGVACGAVAAAERPARRIIGRILRRAVRLCATMISPKQMPVAGEAAEDVPEYPFEPLPARFVSAVLDEVQSGFDLVQLEFVQMLSLGACLPTHVPKVFVHHQLQCVYMERRAAVSGYQHYGKYLQQMMLLQEQAYLQKFDAIVVFSEQDAGRLRQWVSGEKIFVSPFPVIGTAAGPDVGIGDFRLLFVGSESHYPNRDGLEWLLTKIWPEVLNQVPDCKLRVIGRWSEGKIARLAAAGLEFSGFVPDLADSLRGGAMVVPIRVGSGIRVKVLDAMSQGIPVISTSIGCEGIPARDESEILIRDDSAGFADAIVRVVRNRELRERLTRAGRVLVSRIYSPEMVRKEREGIYRSMLARNHDDLPASHQGE